MALVMGKWGCWLAVAVHVVVRGKEAMLEYSFVTCCIAEVWTST